jgi:thiaminase/transcriptional activator TenA
MTGDAPTFDGYAADRTAPRFTDWLRERSSWTAATAHPFVCELVDGSLDDEAFRRYLRQDYAFLDELASLVGHAAGDAPTTAARAELAGFLGTLTDDEDDYFERSFAALDVPEESYRDPPLAPVTREFRTLLGLAAREGGYAESLAVLVPVEWVYLSWARDAGARPERFYLAEWIDLHADPSFAEFVGWLRGELDRYGPDLDERRQRRIAELFEHAVDLEAAFFETVHGGDARSLSRARAADTRPAGDDGGGC